MSTTQSPSLSDDFVLVEQNYRQNLAIRTRSRQDEIEQNLEDQSGDSDLELVSRPGSVRSLSSRSPSPFTADYEHDDDDITMTSTAVKDPGHIVDPALRHHHTIQPICDIFDHFPSTEPSSRGLAATKSSQSATSRYAYHKSPDDAFPGAGVLVPSPTSVPRHRHANLEYDSPPISINDVEALRNNVTSKLCDHTTVDQYIMDALIENALITRLELEFGSSGPREQHLRQQMMARLRSLPVHHPVVKEAMKHARWGSFLFQHQYRDAAERKHIYTNVFTDIEVIALHLLLECHKQHFGVACSFADLPETFTAFLLGQLDTNSFTKGSKLALHIQTNCIMATGSRQVRPFLDQDQLRRRTRTEILQQAGRLESIIEFADTLTQLEASMRNSPITRSLSFEEIDLLKHAFYERVAIRNVLNDTLTSLPDVGKLQIHSQAQARPRRSSGLKREAPEDDISSALSPLSPPAKKPSIPGAYPITESDKSSSSTSATYSYGSSAIMPPAQVGTPPHSILLPCYVCTNENGQYNMSFDSTEELRHHLSRNHIICGNRSACDPSIHPSLTNQSHESTGRALDLIVKIRLAEKGEGRSFRDMTNGRQRAFLDNSDTVNVHFGRFACFLCAVGSGEDSDGASDLEELKAHLCNKHCRVWSSSRPQFACPKCDNRFPAHVSLGRHLLHCTTTIHGGAMSMALVHIEFLEAAKRKFQQDVRKSQSKAPETAWCLADYRTEYEISKQQPQLANVASTPRANEMEPLGPRPQQNAEDITNHLPAKQAASSTSLQDWQHQLMLLEQQNKKRLMPQCQEPNRSREKFVKRPASISNATTVGPAQSASATTTSSINPAISTGHRLQDYMMQLSLLEQQNKKRQMLEAQKPSAEQSEAQHKQERTSPPNINTRSLPELQPVSVSLSMSLEHRRLEAYQMQLMLLEQQNKKLLMLQRVDDELSKHVQEEEVTGFFRCQVPIDDCNKLFKGREFWKKHVEVRHEEWYAELVDKVGCDGMPRNMKRDSTSTPKAPGEQQSTDSTKATLSSDEGEYRVHTAPTEGLPMNRATRSTSVRDCIGMFEARTKTIPNKKSTTLPIRSARSMAATNRDIEGVKELSFCPESQHRPSSPYPANVSDNDSLNAEPASPAQGSDKVELPGPYARSHTQAATRPVVQYSNGVLWTAFPFAKGPARIKMEYTIRLDVDSIDPTSTDPLFKGTHTFSTPTAPQSSDQADRQYLEWALAHLNPCLRVDKDLLGAAVDHYKQLLASGELGTASRTPLVQTPPFVYGSAMRQPSNLYQALDAGRDEHRRYMSGQQHCLQDYETQCRLLRQHCQERSVGPEMWSQSGRGSSVK